MSKKEIVPVKVCCAGLAKALDVKVGDIVKVECRQGVPLDRFWRNRFKDAAIIRKDKKVDNSIELPKIAAPTQKSNKPGDK